MSKEKAEKLTGQAAVDRVFEYMKDTNRPYSVQNVFDNLRGAVPKKQVEIIMEKLVSEQKLVKKMFGKFVVYLIEQSVFGDSGAAEIEALEKNVKALEENLKSQKAEEGKVSAEIAELESRAQCIEGLETAKRGHAEMTVLFQQSSEAVENFKSAGPLLVTGQDLDDKIVVTNKEVSKRRRLCKDVLSLISESMDCSISAAADSVGIDIEPA
eukprot:gene136-35_t